MEFARSWLVYTDKVRGANGIRTPVHSTGGTPARGWLVYTDARPPARTKRNNVG